MLGASPSCATNKGQAFGQIIGLTGATDCSACQTQCGNDESCNGWSYAGTSAECTLFATYFEGDGASNGSCVRGTPPAPAPPAPTCYPTGIGLTGVASITHYGQNDSSVCSDSSTPGCWSEGGGREGVSGNVDYSVAVPHAWFSNKGIRLRNQSPLPTGHRCSSNEHCAETDPKTGQPYGVICTEGHCWGDIPGNCDTQAKALTLRCSGGGLASCTSDKDCSSGLCGDDNKCLSQSGQLCHRDEDCAGSGKCGASVDGRPRACYGGGDWAGNTCSNGVWEVVQGQSIDINGVSYTEGDPVCWALVSKDSASALDKINHAVDCNSNAACIVVQADNTCGGNCACVENCKSDGTVVRGWECNATHLGPPNKTQCNTLKGGDLYALSHRCIPGVNNAKSTWPDGGWGSVSTIPGAKAPTDGWALSDTGSSAQTDWCGGRYVHFDIRAGAMPDALASADGGVTTAHFKRIKCPAVKPGPGP